MMEIFLVMKIRKQRQIVASDLGDNNYHTMILSPIVVVVKVRMKWRIELVLVGSKEGGEAEEGGVAVRF